MQGCKILTAQDTNSNDFPFNTVFNILPFVVVVISTIAREMCPVITQSRQGSTIQQLARCTFDTYINKYIHYISIQHMLRYCNLQVSRSIDWKFQNAQLLSRTKIRKTPWKPLVVQHSNTIKEQSSILKITPDSIMQQCLVCVLILVIDMEKLLGLPTSISQG